MEHPSPVQQPLRNALVTVGGSLLVLAGALMLVTPGPGLVTIAAGLAVLARRHRWARQFLASVRAKIAKERRKMMEKNK